MLKEADRAPTSTHSTGKKCAHLQNCPAELIDGCEWLIIKLLISRYRDDSENDGKETCEAWEGTNPIGKVSTEAGRVIRMKEGT